MNRRAARTSSRPQRSGFTLIEIMVVIGILGIVLAMGVPPFVRMMQKDSLRKAVSDLEEACSTARAQAILQGAPSELTLRSTDGQLTVSPGSRANTGQGAAGGVPSGDAAPAKASVFSAHLGEDVKVNLVYVNLKNQMEAKECHVHFYPNGTSDEFTIVLQTGLGVRKISLDCITALVNVEVIR